MDIGIPLADQTKTPSMPSLPPPNTSPAQPAIDAEAEKKAREGQQFAWAPNQSVQASGITGTRDEEFRGRAARVAVNQATEQIKAQTEAVKAQVSVVESEIARLSSEISSLSSQADTASQQAAAVSAQAGPLLSQASALEQQAASIKAGLTSEGIQNHIRVADSNAPQSTYNIQPAQLSPQEIEARAAAARRAEITSDFINRSGASEYDLRTGRVTQAQYDADRARIKAIEDKYRALG